MPEDTLWELEPHTRAKHEILKRYLGAWFAIMNRYNRELLYLDGFCGPGEYTDGEPGSPIIALEVASDHIGELDADITFWFIDHRADRVQHLEGKLAEHRWPGNFSVEVNCGEFEDVFQRKHDVSSEAFSLPPTFAFLDPFGFSGMPFDLIARLLACPRCEAFINLSVDSINRFLDHPNDKIRSYILQAFATERVLAVPEQAGDRVEAFRMLYQEQLEGVARFVRFFEMRDQRNHVPYYLFFATNHPLGFAKMKDAMWKVDPDGDFTFSDKTDPHMETLFSADCTADVALLLEATFGALGSVKSDDLLSYVASETPYLEKHARSALKRLETDGRILVNETKADGKPRKRGTFPTGAVVSFVSNEAASQGG